MVKLVYCLKRLPDVSEEEFYRYWLERHGPLVRSLADAMRFSRYIQVHTRQTPFNDMLRRSRALSEGYDGVAELWWDSEDQMIDALSTPEGMEAQTTLSDDEATFIDFANSCMWVGDVYTVYEENRE